MSRVFCIGESLLDIIFENSQPVHATPGGAMLNTAVSLGRAGVDVTMISDCGTDKPGDLIVGFLQNSGVSTSGIYRYKRGKTALALAFLDSNKEASYTFYKDYPEDRFPLSLPAIERGDIILFGSIYSLLPNLHRPLTNFLRQARNQGAMIIYDPNFRRPHLDDLEEFKPRIISNILHADIVRASDEDLNLIFGAQLFEQAYAHVSGIGCKALVYTRNKGSVDAILQFRRFTLDVPSIQPVSTIGAGDAFNAGLIYGMLSRGFTAEGPNLPPEQTEWILRCGTAFATNVCMSLENYISHDFANHIKEAQTHL